MYYTQKKRSSVLIDISAAGQKSLVHGRVGWFERVGATEREMVYWDGFEKRFLSPSEFEAARRARAAANRRLHAHTPFGPEMRAARRERERYIHPSLGWASP